MYSQRWDYCNTVKYLALVLFGLRIFQKYNNKFLKRKDGKMTEVRGKITDTLTSRHSNEHAMILAFMGLT